MKKILLTLVTMLAAVSMNAQNTMKIEVGETSNLAKIPVNIIFNTTEPMIGLQASFTLPEGLGASNFKKSKGAYVVINPDFWPYDEDNDDYDASYYTFSGKKEEMFTNSAPNDLLVSITSGTDASAKMIASDGGTFATFTFDGSTLADGEYVVKMYKATLFPSASVRYDQEDYEAKFKIESGTAVGVGAIKANNTAAHTGIYNIAGQRLDGLQKGINIVNGQKVIVK